MLINKILRDLKPENISLWIDDAIEWMGEGLKEVGFDWGCNRSIITVNDRYFRPAEVESLLGDPTKAKEKLGWEPKISFDELVEDMVLYGQ